jgi:hypothetical protein
MLMTAEYLAHKLNKPKNKAKVEVLKYALEHFEIFKYEDASNHQIERAHQLLCAIKLYHSLYSKHLKGSELANPGKDLLEFLKEYRTEAEAIIHAAIQYHSIPREDSFYYDDEFSESEDNELEHHHILADYLADDLQRFKDRAKLDILSYAIVQFTNNLKSDLEQQDVERAWQVVHAYTLYHSLFKKRLRNTELHELGKALDENAKMFDDLANRFIKHIEEIKNITTELNERVANEMAQMSRIQELSNMIRLIHNIKICLAAENVARMNRDVLIHANYTDETTPLLEDTEELDFSDFDETIEVRFIQWRDNPLLEETDSPVVRSGTPSSLGLFSPESRRRLASAQEVDLDVVDYSDLLFQLDEEETAANRPSI